MKVQDYGLSYLIVLMGGGKSVAPVSVNGARERVYPVFVDLFERGHRIGVIHYKHGETDFVAQIDPENYSNAEVAWQAAHKDQ